MFLLSVVAFAKEWTVYTTCGVRAHLSTSDNITSSELQSLVAAINYNECSTIPRVITVVL